MVELTETEVIKLLKTARAAITQGLVNLGVPEDEVETYAMAGPSFTVFANPGLVNRLGPGFALGGPAASDNSMCNGSCGALGGIGSENEGM
jgi:hypothetical protein